jgi:NifB/MoaA-like Fe-S oxidoreductase
VSDHTTEESMRPHTREEASRVLDIVGEWQERFTRALGRRLVYAADEYFLLADRPFPSLEEYDDLVQHENGIGMARAFEADVRAALAGDERGGAAPDRHAGFFAWVEGAPAEGYRAPRAAATDTATPVMLRSGAPAPVVIVTGEYGARVLEPLVDDLARATKTQISIAVVPNHFFGGNIAVTGLLTGADVAQALDARAHDGARCLLPDVVLSNGRFLDGATVADLPRPVEVVPTDGRSLVAALRS